MPDRVLTRQCDSLSGEVTYVSQFPKHEIRVYFMQEDGSCKFPERSKSLTLTTSQSLGEKAHLTVFTAIQYLVIHWT